MQLPQRSRNDIMIERSPSSKSAAALENNFKWPSAELRRLINRQKDPRVLMAIGVDKPAPGTMLILQLSFSRNSVEFLDISTVSHLGIQPLFSAHLANAEVSHAAPAKKSPFASGLPSSFKFPPKICKSSSLNLFPSSFSTASNIFLSKDELIPPRLLLIVIEVFSTKFFGGATRRRRSAIALLQRVTQDTNLSIRRRQAPPLLIAASSSHSRALRSESSELRTVEFTGSSSFSRSKIRICRTIP
mmetsp:Transcript_6565/g.12814  ORF Transcript_6565/g.12814 Transcript_6565/m.12814 type:complete len:245 (+) Transcript_6565:269-1003(+)